jgi:hypothetical protein
MRVKQWKIALSLAIIGALAGPFVFRTYRLEPTYEILVALTAEEKESIAAELRKTNDCQVLRERWARKREIIISDIDQPAVITSTMLSDNDYLRKVGCEMELEKFQAGGQHETYFDSSKYLAINLMAAALMFGLVYALTFALPALLRRYWEWLTH